MVSQIVLLALFSCMLYAVTGVEQAALLPIVPLDVLRAAKSDHNMLRTHHIPNLLAIEYDIIERRSLEKLLAGLERHLKEEGHSAKNTAPFGDLVPSLYLNPIFAHKSDGKGESEKYFIGTETIKRLGKNFIVYAAGIAGQPSFENYMADLGSTVAGFDCTDTLKPEYKFDFYDWCLGSPQSFEHSVYAEGQSNQSHTFYTLRQAKEKLGHKKINMLKLDIEGFEWNLLQSEIIDGDEDMLPEQLLFELHTEGANPGVVPPGVVANKRANEVNTLVLHLWKRGYRLINIELNAEDPLCAELSFLRLTHTHSAV
jgi:hypothetical protein